MKRIQSTPIRLLSCNKMLEKIDMRLGFAPDRELEEKAELPRNKLNKLRTGKQYLRADEIWRIARALDVPVAWLLDDDWTNPSESSPHPTPDLPGAIQINRGPDWWTNGGHKPSGRKPKNGPSRK